MLITRRQTPIDLHLTFDGREIGHSNIHKHLGLTFNTQANWTNHLEETIRKANQRLGILRNLKYILGKEDLKTLYISNIRSLLEYADCVWDCIPDNLVKRIERININALRCITGLTASARLNHVYQESGLLPLETRRRIHRLTQFYKIVHGSSPDYLRDLLSETTAERNPYAVRNNDTYTFTKYQCRTESFKKSFIPKTIDEWNTLPPNIRSAPSIASFKRQLKTLPSFKASSPPLWYSIGKRKLNIIHAQLRNKCSNLEGDLHSNYIKRSADCQQCRTNSKEDARHYFLACPKYINLRDKLKDEFAHNNFDFDMNVILKGDITKNYDQNRIITLAVQTYIFETGRFSNAE